MAAARHRAHKHFLLDPRKIRKAQKLLGAKTETETVERALDEVITERERNRLAWQGVERFVRSGAEIRDVTGALDGK
jgi:hypothetical protein